MILVSVLSNKCIILWFLKPALNVIGVSWSFLFIVRVIDDKNKFSFWYIEVSACYVYNLVYLCRSLLEQEIELVLKPFSTYKRDIGLVLLISGFKVDAQGTKRLIKYVPLSTFSCLCLHHLWLS